MSQFNEKEVWTLPDGRGIKPSKLVVKSESKGSSVDAPMHKAGVLHGRDPMRCPVAMLGLYFAYQFLQLSSTELPRFDNWLTSMHERPLVRNQEGNAAHVTNFNGKLSEELDLIGAKASGFTLHNWRGQRARQAAENNKMQYQSRKSGGGWTAGCFENNYDGCMQTDYMLEGANYDGVEPEQLAAHDCVFYEYMWSGGDQGVFGGNGAALIDMLYRERRSELLELEAKARELAAQERKLPRSGERRPGEAVLEFLTFVRHAILVWIVTTAARPRDASGYINAESPTKLDLCAPEFTAHLSSVRPSTPRS